MARELVRLGRGIDAAADLHWRGKSSGKSRDPASAAVVTFPLLLSPLLPSPLLPLPLPLPLLPTLALRKDVVDVQKGQRRQEGC